MTAPKRFGGSEASLLTQCEVLAEIARGCPSASWVATVLSAIAILHPQTNTELYGRVLCGLEPNTLLY